jgi:hypothetical protein
MRRSGVEPRTVLIVGSETDPHVAAVSSLCRQMGARCVALSGETFFTLHFGGDRRGRARSDAKISMLAGEPISVWWRLKPSFFREKQVDPITMFERREWAQTLESLEGLFPSAKWVNPRAAERSISHKPNQLRLAQQCGLRIPDTIVSNNPKVVRNFVARQPNRQAIHKIFSWINGPAGETVYTNIVDLNFISRHANSIKNVQEYSRKSLPKHMSFEL